MQHRVVLVPTSFAFTAQVMFILVMSNHASIVLPSFPLNGGGASHSDAFEQILPIPKSCVGASLTEGERLIDGVADGSKLGALLTEGRTLGPDEGCWDGFELGIKEGCWDAALGSRVGVLEGSGIGNAELLLGPDDGNSEGSRVGVLEGCELGNAELSLGPNDGKSEGYDKNKEEEVHKK